MIAKYWNLLNKIVDFVAAIFADTLLLLIRGYWGCQFFVSGKGKLMNLDDVTKFFSDLQIPAPHFNAILASCTECFGGLLLMAGLLTRLTTIPLIVTMVVAYLSVADDKAALLGILNDQDPFFKATPFLFLYASLIIFAFGPGRVSLDALLHLIFRKRR